MRAMQGAPASAPAKASSEPLSESTRLLAGEKMPTNDVNGNAERLPFVHIPARDVPVKDAPGDFDKWYEPTFAIKYLIVLLVASNTCSLTLVIPWTVDLANLYCGCMWLSSVFAIAPGFLMLVPVIVNEWLIGKVGWRRSVLINYGIVF